MIAGFQAAGGLEVVGRARRWLRGQLRRLGTPPELAVDVELALGEALNNVIEHAYGGRGGWVQVTLRAEGNELCLVVRDRGRPFRPPAPPVDPHDLRERGYGLLLIHRLASEVEWRPGGRRGTELVLRWRR